MADVLTRRAGPASVDREARTARAIASTFADVPRAAPAPDGAFVAWTERLDPAGMDLGRFIGAPLLADHENRTSALAGVVEAAERGPKGLEVLLRFAASPLGDEALALVADGMLRGVSIGYRVTEWRAEPARDGRPIFSAARWSPLECSLVPVAADEGAHFRAATIHDEGPRPMTETTTTTRDAAAEAIRAAERTRIASLRETAEVSAAILDRGAIAEAELQAVGGGWAPERFRAALLELAIRRGEQVRAPALTPVCQFGTSHDAPGEIRGRMVEALASRVAGREPSERAREFRGMTIAELAAELLTASGHRLGRSAAPSEIIGRALTTSDFPLLLQGTMSRLLQDRLAAAPGAARTICAPRSVRDFRPGRFVQAAGARDLHRLAEGAEIQHASAFERGESYRVETWARTMFFTRQALVNDDLGAFEQTMLLSNAVVSVEAAEFSRMFEPNGASWGPTLTDGLPLFHLDRGNVAAGAVGTAGISAGRVVMRGQRDVAGNLIAPEPRFLLVGPAGETAAEQALSQIAVATG